MGRVLALAGWARTPRETGPGPGRLGEDTQGEETEDDPEDPESVLALIK